jgi:hypothetical protein
MRERDEPTWRRRDAVGANLGESPGFVSRSVIPVAQRQGAGGGVRTPSHIHDIVPVERLRG